MKKILYILLVSCMGITYSCADMDFDDQSKLTNPWVNPEAGNLYLNSLYNSTLPTYGFGANANYTDESDGTSDLVRGNLSEGSVTNFDLVAYERIRYINLGIKGCSESNLTEAQKEPLLGQMYFLRAYEYFELTKLYGGVPLVLESQDVEGVDVVSLNIERSTAKQCFEQIIQDLDLAVKYCPSAVGATEYGRVSQMAAAAFRGRVYLTFASPLFNPQNDQERWRKAYDACLEAKKLAQAKNRGLYPVFNEIFLKEGLDNQEIVWVIPYSFSVGKTHGWENSIRPANKSNIRNARPGCVPTVELTDAFPMKDGKSIGNSSYPYDMQAYWLNRDDRFKATVSYNGSDWNIMSTGAQWSYQDMDNKSQKNYMLNMGAFTRKASNAALSNNVSAGEYTSATGVDWIEIRYAEVLLNLAECANEVSFSDEAYTELYAIRQRAGIAEGSNTSERYGLKNGMTKDELREVILKERFVEFAYENKRYWDLRRRLMYTQALGVNTPAFNGTRRNTYVVNVSTKKNPVTGKNYTAADIDSIRNVRTININTEYSELFRTVKTRRDIQKDITYLKKYYFFDIPANILQRCIKVEQTIGWPDSRSSISEGVSTPGTFDPLSDQGGTPWKNEL